MGGMDPRTCSASCSAVAAAVSSVVVVSDADISWLLCGPSDSCSGGPSLGPSPRQGPRPPYCRYPRGPVPRQGAEARALQVGHLQGLRRSWWQEGRCQDVSFMLRSGVKVMFRQLGPMMQQIQQPCNECEALRDHGPQDRCKTCHGKKVFRSARSSRSTSTRA
jgi:hypothetical protein